MTFIDLKKMKLFGLFKGNDYRNSPNRETYEEIAATFGLKAQDIYELAHGRKPKTREESEVLGILIDKGIIGKRNK